MPSVTRVCPACATPLPGGVARCAVCGSGSSGEPDVWTADPATALERVRRALDGRYTVERVVGEGGTATVYLAHDRRHRRKVALKVLRPEIASLVGPTRFLREIEIAARLQHPHILPVYDSGEVVADGMRLLFYVMPFATESLASRLATGPLPLGDAVRILSQVADALAFAHAAGVVHRDIKPDNVMLAGRHAMVADFGIAKALTVPIPGHPSTGPGVPIGTPYYMSPEQVAAESEVDGRADQYALGVLAYELLGGRRPFMGETVQEVLASQILDQPAPLERLQPEVPPGLARVIMRALEKEPERRWARTEEMAHRLESFALALGSVTPPEDSLGPVTRTVRRARWATLLTAGAAGIVAAALALTGRSGPPAAPMLEQISFSGAVGLAAVSPDGRLLAYSNRETGALLIQEIAGGTPLEIARGFRNVLALRWSPEGGRLLVGASYEGQAGVWMLPRLGGTPRRIGQARMGQWHPSGHRVSTWDYPHRTVLLTDVETGDSVRVPLPGSYDWLYGAEWSPSGTRVAYVTAREPNRFALRVASATGGASGVLVEDTVPIASPRWAADESALYYLSGGAELWKVRPRRNRPGARGHPIFLLDGLQAAPSGAPGAAVPFTITGDGRRLIYLKALDYSNLWLVMRQSSGRPGWSSPRRLTTGTAQRRGVSLSPDGRWIAYLETSKGGTDLYRLPLAGGRAERLTHTGRVASRQTAWSPAGDRIALGLYDGGAVHLATVPVGAGEVRVVRQIELPAMGDVAWSPGGAILYQIPGNRNFLAFDSESGAQRPLVPRGDQGWVFTAVPSPRGEQVAVYWNRRAAAGVWVVSTRDSSPTLLRPGQADPIGWSADGRAVLTLGWDSTDVARVALDGRIERLGALPFRDPSCASTERAGGDALVCAVPEQVSDVWMVEGFDPERQ